MSIATKKLKAAVKQVNDSGLLEEVKLKNIRVIGVKTEALLNEFGDAVDALADAKIDSKLDPSVIKYYNEAFGEDSSDPEKEKEKEPEKEPEKESGSEKKKEPEKEKSEPKVKEKSEPKEKKKAATKPRSCYGHIASAKSGQLDEMLNTGATYAELMEECDVKLHRVKGHINVLKKKGLTVLINEDKDKPENTKVSIEEDSI